MFKHKNKILIQAKKYETPVFKTKNQRITKHMTLKTFTFIKKHPLLLKFIHKQNFYSAKSLFHTQKENHPLTPHFLPQKHTYAKPMSL